MFDGVHSVVHLAANGRPGASFMDEVLPSNIVGMYNVCEEARRAGVKRLVFASTNHTQIKGWEINNGTDLENFAGKRFSKKLIKIDDHYSPSSPYGVSKIFGEELGHYYATKMDAFEFVSLRIGWYYHNDPTAHLGKPLEHYLKAMWISKRDIHGWFKAALQCRLKNGNKTATAYAISNNTERCFDLNASIRTLNYTPKDDSSDYF